MDARKIDHLEKENMILNESNPQHQKQENKETGVEGNQGKWGKGGWWVDDPWKDWKGRDDTTNENNDCVNDVGKWEQKFERVGKDDRGTRVWWGGA